jgi:integrase/recombinase XerD
MGRPSPDQASTRSSDATPPGSTSPEPAEGSVPTFFRHTAAVHLLESGVEVNVIRGWLGHADLSTTNRYAEINTRTKQEALRACEPSNTSAGSRTKPIWQTDETLLKWLNSL